MTPYYESEHVQIWNGDTLDVLAALVEAEISVDAVVTDPPYASGTRLEAKKSSSGAMLRAGRFHDRPIELDQMTTTGFVWLMRAVGQRCRPLLPDGGSFLSFIDWRQWPNLVGALETCNYRVQGMVVWDKGSMGLGNGFRAQHELICHASKGVPTVVDRGVGNVLRCPREEPTPSPEPEACSAHATAHRVRHRPRRSRARPLHGLRVHARCSPWTRSTCHRHRGRGAVLRTRRRALRSPHWLPRGLPVRGGFVTSWPLKRTPLRRVSKKKARTDRAYAKARQVVLARADWQCEGNVEGICPPGPHRAEHVHHVRLRSQGGTHDPANLRALCHVAHDWAHHNPLAAQQLGLIDMRGYGADGS